MTTQALARRFTELLGWEIEESELGWLARRPLQEGERFRFKFRYWSAWDELCYEGSSPLAGWPAIGIILDEMTRHGFLWNIDGRFPGSVWAAFAPRSAGHTLTWRHALATEPLDAVLQAAVAALEANR